MIISDKFIYGALFDNFDINEMLKIIRKTPDDFIKYFKKYNAFLGVESDKSIIEKFIYNDNLSAEDFDRYDSAVGDTFVAMFYEFCKNEDYTKYIEDVNENFLNDLKKLYKPKTPKSRNR